MRSILAGIITLTQHLALLHSNPEKFRPQCCPSCGKSGLWCHGGYTRKADYENTGASSLNPVTIPRYYCQFCHSTCSVLPEYIPPQRHYPWLIQQSVLLSVLSGNSYQKASKDNRPSRWTISRWQKRLKKMFLMHASHLRSLLPNLGRMTGFNEFWQSVLKEHSLSNVMLILNNAEVIIP